MSIASRISAALAALRGKGPQLPRYVPYLPNWITGDYRAVPATPQNLVRMYRDAAYACANLNARGVARVPIRLYVRTATGQRKARLKTKSIDTDTKLRLCTKAMMSDENVEEVTEHPMLELLDRPCVQDGIPVMGRFTFLEITQMYLEVVGRSYWMIERGPLDIPSCLWILPAQYVEPWRNAGSTKIVDEYRYTGGTTFARYKPNELIPFTIPSLADPYTGGMSPLAAAIERSALLEKYLGFSTSTLSNRARPDGIVSPANDDGMVGMEDRARLDSFINGKFREGGAGSILIATSPLRFDTVSYPGKDIAELTEQEQSLSQIARCFDVPLSMLHKDANRASAKEGRAQHANDALAPRCTRMDDVLNTRLVPLYDPSGRLFCCHDDPVPVDPDAESQIHERYVKMQAMTPNEVRRERGYDDIEGGDEVVKPPEKPAPGEEGDKKKPKPSASGKAIEGFGPKELAEYASASAALRAGEPIRGLQWR